MKRQSAWRRCVRQEGSEAMSSRWISTSLRSGLPFRRAEPELAAHLGVRGLHQRRLAHAARAPQQGVVGGQPLREAARVVEQLLGGAVDALEQAERLAVDVRHRQEGLRRGLPHVGLALLEVRLGRRRRRQPVERGGKALEALENGLLVAHCSAGRPWKSADRPAGSRSIDEPGAPVTATRSAGDKPPSAVIIPATIVIPASAKRASGNPAANSDPACRWMPALRCAWRA